MASPWKVRASGVPQPDAPPPEIDRAAVRAALEILVDPDRGFQLQAAPHFSYATFIAAELDEAVEWAARQNAEWAPSIYYALNAVDANLTHRVTVPDVQRRRWLFIDVDRAKTKETNKLSATAAEHEAAQELAADVAEWLDGCGWPRGLIVDSGNGWHLLYRIDLPNDEESRLLVRDCLKALAEGFDDGRGSVGKECHDARRLAKLPGTWARKGPHAPDRPHRMCRLAFVPDPLVVLTPDLIKAATKPPADAAGANGVAEHSPFVVRTNGGGSSGYARAALERECAKMALTTPGHLNDQLFRSAAALGNFVPGGHLTEQEITERLYAAGQSAGCDDEHKDLDTIRRGIEAGKTTPRVVPESDRVPAAPKAKKPGKGDRPETRRLTDLLNMTLPPPNWAVPGLLGEGLSILAGKPKLGKSFLALNLGITIAAGGTALGMSKVQPGDVLYLSLEDRWRRVQDRARKLLKGLDCGASDRLEIAVAWPRQVAGGLDHLDDWMGRVERPALVIIDVWQKFRPVYKQGSQYEQDYEAASAVKSLADARNTSLLIIHHCKKAPAEDVMDEISGTLGLSGAADGLLVLTRARNENEGKLFVSGRDAEEREIGIQFDPTTFAWKSLGDAKLMTESKIKQAIMELFRRSGGTEMFPSEVASAIGKDSGTVKTYLWRMWQDGVLKKVGHKYGWPVEDMTEAGVQAF